MRAPGTTMGLRFEALYLRTLWQICHWLGPELASDVGAALLRWLSPSFRCAGRIRKNVEVLFADQSEAERERLTRDIISNFGRALAEYPHLERIMTTEVGDRIEFVAATPEAALTPDRPAAIYIGAHQANWEVLSVLSRPLKRRMTIVVTPRPNPFVDLLVRKARPASVVEQLDRDSATRGLLRALQSGSSVGLLADHRFKAGRMVPFFGHDALTAIGPARLAVKLGRDLVPTRIERIGRVRFRITTFPAVQPDPAIPDDTAKAVDMMRRVNLLFEAWIRERPEQWMCLKRRWPKAVSAEQLPLQRMS